MGKVQTHPPVKLICALTYQALYDLAKLYKKLEGAFSSIEMLSQPFDFDLFTDYYTEEMGPGLKKHFIVFSALIDPFELPAIKRWTNKLEGTTLNKEKRLVNIDPGYISQAKLVLATTKNYSHRVYLGKGIFGDVHMHYQRGKYRPNSWTYPDYKAEQNVAFFGKVREKYLAQLVKDDAL